MIKGFLLTMLILTLNVLIIKSLFELNSFAEFLFCFQHSLHK